MIQKLWSERSDGDNLRGKTNCDKTSSIDITPRPVLNQSISEYQSGSLKLVLEYEWKSKEIENGQL